MVDPTLSLLAVLAASVVLALGASRAQATDERVRFLDGAVAHIESGTSSIDISAAVYTSYVTLLTIEPVDGFAIS